MNRSFYKTKTLKKRAARFSFLFYLNLTIISLLIISANRAKAQTDCSIRLSATSVASRCQADGEIHCTLSDTAGAELEQIRYSYIPLSGIDSIVETSDSVVRQFRPGSYKVKVVALCRTGLGQGDEYAIISDSVFIEVGSEYQIPSSGFLYNIFSFQTPFGIVPSLKCYPSGQVQIKIEQGNFPYTVDIWTCEAGDTVFWKSVVFDTLQHYGNDPMRHDYKHYYTIGDMPAGDFKFICHDACGYYMPALYGSVPLVQHDLSKEHHLLRNSSGDPTSHNIVTFKEIFDIHHIEGHNDEYYYYINDSLPMLEYRFVNPTLGASSDTTRWYDLPKSNNNMAFLYDTLASAGNYGEIWFKNIQLQFRHKLCEDTIWAFNFTIYPQGNNQHSKLTSLVFSKEQGYYYDFCRYHLNEYAYDNIYTGYYMYHNCFACGSEPDSTNCTLHNNYTYSGGITSTNDGTLRHSYVTYPIHFRVTDITRGSVVEHTIDSSLHYCWTATCIKDTLLFNDTLIVEITDDKGCPIESFKTVIKFETKHYEYPAVDYYYKWDTVPSQGICSGNERSIGLIMTETTPYTRVPDGRFTYFGDTICLIESPKSNFYNLRAYIDKVQHYHVEKARSANTAKLLYKTYTVPPYYEYPGLVLSDYGLPSGKYTWVIHHACERPNDTLVQWITFPEDPVIVEEPRYQFTSHCSNLEITPTSGQIQINGEDVETFFQVHRESNFSHSANSITKGESTFIGIPGTYTLSMYALPKDDEGLLSENPCYIKDTVITWDGGTIKLDYLYSHVCNSHDSTGFVRARGKNGMLPYSYTVFDRPEGQGSIIDQNTTGDFDNLPIHYGQQLSIMMTDACGAHFLTDFIVNDMESIRKGWAENDLNEISLCEGVTCHFYGISLGGVSFHWTGPDGFNEYEQNPELFIPRNTAAAGTYQIEVLGTGCSPLVDSIRLDVLVAPYVHLAKDTSVCPGSEIAVTSTAYGTGTITYTIMREDTSAQSIRELSHRNSGDTDSTYSIITQQQTIFYVKEISDSRCSYHIPEDTVKITLIDAYEPAELWCTNDTICKGEAAVITARASSVPPYVIKWQTNDIILARDTIRESDESSHYYFPALFGNTTLHALAESAYKCPYYPGRTAAGTLSRDASVIVYGDRRIDTTIRQTIHEEDLPYLWHGQLYTAADSSTRTFPRAHGCDSTVTFILRIIPEAACPDAIDYDGNIYHAVRIDHLCWTQSNLRSEHYSDGRAIDNVMSYYSDQFPSTAENVEIFGNLYTYESAADTGRIGLTPQGHLQGICPSGWHLPEEWQYQRLSLHDISELRSPFYWLGGGGNNATGFSALPAGFFNGQNNRFENLLGETRFWFYSAALSPHFSPTFVINRHCDSDIKSISSKGNGYSIRCILEE